MHYCLWHGRRIVRLRASLAAALFALAAIAPPAAACLAASYGDLRWRSIGPAQSGGRLGAVAGTDSDPYLYYVGAAGGGVWKTKNAGDTWQPVFDTQPVASIGAIAIAPSNVNVVWVGTGEANPRNDVSAGDGVWKTADGGKHWSHRGLDRTSQISRVLVDPRDPNSVLVGALGDPFRDDISRGVYRTTDGGKSWRKTLYVGPSSGVSDMDWDPRNPKVIYAGIWQYRRSAWFLNSGGPADGLYRSSDGGSTWRRLQGHGLPGGLMGRIGLAVAPSNPKRVYALIQSKQGLLWRSDDGGSNWHWVSSNTLINQRPFYFSHIFVDPRNENHVFATSVRLAESNDGGKTWFRSGAGTKGDHHAMWIAADGRRMAGGDDGGVAFSHDGGATWQWNKNLTIGQFYHIGYDQQRPYRICGGEQDDGSWCAPSQALNSSGILARDWLKIGGGDGTWVWPDPLDPQIIWYANGGEDYGGSLTLLDLRSEQKHDISPYLRDQNAIAIAGLPFRFNWEAPLAFSPQDGRVAYFGGNVVFKTTDRGENWTVISPDLTRNDKSHQRLSGGPITVDGTGAETSDTILDIAPSALAPGLIWVGTDDGLVQLSRDGGAHWANVTMKGAGDFGRVAYVEPSHSDPAAAFALLDRHFLGDRTPYIFATSDYGAHWRSITNALPKDQFVRSIRQDPRNPAILYAGLEESMWISYDTGSHWESLQLNLPTASVRDILVHPRDNDLIVATHGRSIWVLDDITALQELDRARAAGAYFFAPRDAYMYAQWTPTNERAGAGENPPYGAIFTYYQDKPAKRPPALDIVDAGGHVVRRLNKLPNGAGLNRTAWDLTENPPRPWQGAAPWNRGPDYGAEVVPGNYSARLTLGARTLQRTFTVKADPRAAWSPAQYEQRHALLNRLDDQYSQVDGALNDLDGMIKRTRGRRALAEVYALRARLTSNPQNSQDADFLADQLRERIESLRSSVSTGLGPPTRAQWREAEALSVLFKAALDDYRRLRQTLR
jgi:photosystem II stability/assembly factor-like uncharacterized protein